jgi:hypothetical protein
MLATGTTSVLDKYGQASRITCWVQGWNVQLRNGHSICLNAIYTPMSSLTSLSRVSIRLSAILHCDWQKEQQSDQAQFVPTFPIVEWNGTASSFLYSNCKLRKVVAS